MKLTKRGKRVRAVLILLALWGLWQVSAHLFWTGTGWDWCNPAAECVGAMVQTK